MLLVNLCKELLECVNNGGGDINEFLTILFTIVFES